MLIENIVKRVKAEGSILYLAPTIRMLREIIVPDKDVVASPFYWTAYQNNTIGRFSLDMFYIRSLPFLDVWSFIHDSGVYSELKAFQYAVESWPSRDYWGQEHNVGTWRSANGLEIWSINDRGR